MNIAIQQTNDLFYKLNSIQNDIDLPEEIVTSIKAIVDAQEKFLSVVDRFVHNVDDVSKVDVVKDIVDICPQFLSSRNKHGLLPIHTACFRDSCSVYVPLFANAGVKYGVGGVNGRGGLLSETSKRNNVYELLAGSTDAIYDDENCLVETMKILMGKGKTTSTEGKLKTKLKSGRSAGDQVQGGLLPHQQQNEQHKYLYPQRPLLLKEELCDNGFLLKALTNERLSMTKFLIGFDKRKLYSDILDEKKGSNATSDTNANPPNTWPIHIACHNIANVNEVRSKSNYEVFCFLLQSGMKHRSLVLEKGLDDYLGGLFAIDSRFNQTTFELAMEAFGEEKAWKCILKYIPPSNNNNYHVLQRAVSLPLKYLNGFLARYPRAYFAIDDNGSLPIHRALEEGIEWSTELISIINANIHSLDKPDPCHRLHPFALAAAGDKYDLSSIFYMLSLNPEHIASGITHQKTPQNDTVVNDIDGGGGIVGLDSSSSPDQGNGNSESFLLAHSNDHYGDDDISNDGSLLDDNYNEDGISFEESLGHLRF
mmetsp:Transcript_8180/g.12311  ORF Transcript_8180/g.12311 Transcript_8180/m.12311 type:complete len:537 (+) Transcript_8180:70-1680(+)